MEVFFQSSLIGLTFYYSARSGRVIHNMSEMSYEYSEEWKGVRDISFVSLNSNSTSIHGSI